MEVIAAIAIVGIVVAGILAIRAQTDAAALVAREMMTAARLCAGQAALLRADVDAPADGEFAEAPGYHWELRPAAPPADVKNDLKAWTIRVRTPSGRAESEAVMTVWLPKPLAEGAP